jgi:flagellar hook-associated protein 3 FlgL
LNQSESSLSQAVSVTERAREIATEMSNDTQSAETRAQTAAEVGQLLDQAIGLGNTEVGGSYIFAGYHTSTTPFSKITVGGIDTAQYNGDANDFTITIGKSETLTIGTNGQTAFMDSGLFSSLGTLKKALEDNDATAIRQSLTNLENTDNYFQDQISGVGASSNRLDNRESFLSSLNLDVQDRLSQVQDADITKVAVELQEKQLAYQAALQSAVKVTSLNILNYMG